MKTAQLTSVVVARNRSITTGVVIGQRIVDGVPQLAYGMHVVGPGEMLEVDVEEAQRLIATGYAVDPDAPAPTVLRQDGSDLCLLRT